MQNKILELAKSYKEELLRKNEMEYATKEYKSWMDECCDEDATVDDSLTVSLEYKAGEKIKNFVSSYFSTHC